MQQQNHFAKESIYSQDTFKSSLSLSTLGLQNHESHESTSLAKKREKFHAGVRIRNIEQKRSEKRRELIAESMLQSLLKDNSPKQRCQAQEWSFQVLNLLKNSKDFSFEPHHLRSVFELAQRFPSFTTLRLFNLSLEVCDALAINCLFDLDVLSLIHNLIQNPAGQPAIRNQIQQQSNQQWKKSELQTVKLAILTISKLCLKSQKARNFSISIHKSFGNYVKPAYKVCRDNVKTEIIKLAISVFSHKIPKYQSEYLKIYKCMLAFLMDYREAIQTYLKQEDPFQWNSIQSLLQCQNRMTLLLKMFEKCIRMESKWIVQLMTDGMLHQPFGFYQIIETSLALVIRNMRLYEFCISKNNKFPFNQHESHCEISNNRSDCDILFSSSQFIQSTLSLQQKCLTFFSFYSQKMISDGLHQTPQKIPEIIIKAIQILDSYRFLDINSTFVDRQYQQQYDNYQIVEDYFSIETLLEKNRVTLYYVIYTALESQYDRYESFAKKIIQSQPHHQIQLNRSQCGQNVGTQSKISLYELTLYWAQRQSRKEPNFYELNNLAFTLVNSAIANNLEQSICYQFIEKVVQVQFETLNDKYVGEQVKTEICFKFSQTISLLSKSKFGSFPGVLSMICNLFDRFKQNFNDQHGQNLVSHPGLSEEMYYRYLELIQFGEREFQAIKDRQIGHQACKINSQQMDISIQGSI